MLREFVTSNDLASVVEAGERFQFGDRYSFTKVRPELPSALLAWASALHCVHCSWYGFSHLQCVVQLTRL